MPMTKRDFIALADALIRYRDDDSGAFGYNSRSAVEEVSKVLADFCQSRSERFNGPRWFGYIRGENGPNGGRVDADRER